MWIHFEKEISADEPTQASTEEATSSPIQVTLNSRDYAQQGRVIFCRRIYVSSLWLQL